LFGHDSREAEDFLGTPEFWNRIMSRGDFYCNLPLLPDAIDLYQAVAHLKPMILTGYPKGGWSEPRKIAWAVHHFPPLRKLVCWSKDKHFHIMNPGALLVDDYLRYGDLWGEAGGIFIHHVSAKESIKQLAS
jgi:hypothetical protein